MLLLLLRVDFLRAPKQGMADQYVKKKNEERKPKLNVQSFSFYVMFCRESGIEKGELPSGVMMVNALIMLLLTKTNTVPPLL